MTATVTPTGKITTELTVQQTTPRPFVWTVERYHAAIEHGLLTENDRLELIFGHLNEMMPIGKRHRDCVDKINVFFVLKYQSRYKYGVQNPLTIATFSEPEPDFLIYDPETYRNRKGQPLPEDVLLLIEVADATLSYDRTVKGELYARAGIQEYWIINLQSNQVEVYLDPKPELGEYGHIQRYAAEASFESPFCGTVNVSALLPS